VGFVLVLLFASACKPRIDQSEVRSIGQKTTTGAFVVYQAFGNTVYRRVCADQNALLNLGQCPETNKTTNDVRNGLGQLGYTSQQTDTVIQMLSSWTLEDADGASVKQVIDFKDLEKIFGLGVSGTPLVGGGAPTVTVPPPSTVDSPLAKAEILVAMNEIKKQYKMDLNSYVIPCLDNDVPHWSDIVVHYYCQLGAPRSCFTPKARAYSKDLAGYTQAYEECKNETQNHSVNQFDWVVKNQEKEFRYIMYSTYTPGGVKTFNQNDQDAVINAFYGVTNPNDPTDCAKRPVRRNETRPSGKHCGTAQAAAVTTPANGNTTANPAPTPAQPVTPQPAPVAQQPTLNCSANSSATSCMANQGCGWAYNTVTSRAECFQKTGRACQYYTNLGASTCMGATNCGWAFNTQSSKAECYEKTGGSCSSYAPFGAGPCMSSGNCGWAYNMQTSKADCHDKTGRSCSYYTPYGAGACMANSGCNWRYNSAASRAECQ
jgi:hypothetical protein